MFFMVSTQDYNYKKNISDNKVIDTIREKISQFNTKWFISFTDNYAILAHTCTNDFYKNKREMIIAWIKT